MWLLKVLLPSLTAPCSFRWTQSASLERRLGVTHYFLRTSWALFYHLFIPGSE